MSKLLEKIRSGGYWNIAIHPNEFLPDRVDRVSKLYPILRKTSVKLRGWDFPHLNPMRDPRKENDWIEQEFGGEPFLEIWRFYQSGQFVDVSSVPYDWNGSAFYKSGEIINVADSIIRLTEAFELAARLSLTEAGSLFMRIEITHANLASRCLDFNGVREQYAVRGCQSKKNVFSFDKEISQIELITEAKELALEPAAQLFRQFGWEPHVSLLRDIQYWLTGPKAANRT